MKTIEDLNRQFESGKIDFFKAFGAKKPFVYTYLFIVDCQEWNYDFSRGDDSYNIFWKCADDDILHYGRSEPELKHSWNGLTMFLSCNVEFLIFKDSLRNKTLEI